MVFPIVSEETTGKHHFSFSRDGLYHMIGGILNVQYC